MLPFLLTCVIAVSLHLSGILWQQPDMHDPDITSIMFICSILMMMMHPTSTVPPYCTSLGYRRFRTVLYMIQCLVIQYMAVTFPWISFNRLLVRTLPGDMVGPFSGRMLLATATLIIAICRWRRLSNQVINDAINEVYMEILGNGGFFPYLDLFPLNSGIHLCKIARFFISKCTSASNMNPPPQRRRVDDDDEVEDDDEDDDDNNHRHNNNNGHNPIVYDEDGDDNTESVEDITYTYQLPTTDELQQHINRCLGQQYY